MMGDPTGADTDPVSAHAVPDGCQLWLIRHGETEWSKSGQHTGRTDLDLTGPGEEQARRLAPLLAGLHPALVLSSPRRRSLHTAELAGLPIDDIDDDLAEWDYGDFEGLTTAQIRERVPGWTIWTRGGSNGENPAQVAARADRVLARAARYLADGPVVLVSHGHFSRALGARWIGLTIEHGANLLLDTAAPSVLSWQYGAPVIDRWNMDIALTEAGR